MPRQRFLNMPADAREKLLSLALNEFAEKGFEEASLNEILAKQGISKGAYYYYFDDKEDLLATAVEGVVDNALAQLPLPAFNTLAPEEFWPAVEGSLVLWLERFDSLKPLFRALGSLNGARRQSPRFAPLIAKTQKHWRTLIEAGQRLGCIRTDLPNDLLVRLLATSDAVLDGAFFDAHSNVTRASFKKHMRLVLDTMKRLLAVAGPPMWSRQPARKPRSRRHA
jgi:AcrR family transcriptional regulator